MCLPPCAIRPRPIFRWLFSTATQVNLFSIEVGVCDAAHVVQDLKWQSESSVQKRTLTTVKNISCRSSNQQVNFGALIEDVRDQAARQLAGQTPSPEKKESNAVRGMKKIFDVF